jgi:O-acetyl-ADP-ribose deacetylase (regulator of RNase III)
MARRGARPGDWKTKPMPEPRATIRVRRVFSHEDMARLREGLLPEEMEDKWFVVWEGGELHLYRSWTGNHVYTVRFEPAPWGERIAEVVINADPAQVKSGDAAGQTLLWVLDVVVLGRSLRSLGARTRPPEIVLERMDITTADDDAIVNAANETVMGGGGVDGAMHRAAGPELLAACRSLPEVRPGVRCPTGEARITPAFGRLRARWVVHAVGPRYTGSAEDARLLASAVRSALDLAEEHGACGVALPAISCGIFGYPVEEAAQVAVGVVRERAWTIDRVRFALWDERAMEAWREAVARHG